MSQAPGHMGWVYDQQAIETLKEKLPTAMMAAPQFADADDGKDFFFFDYEAMYLKTLKDAGIDYPAPTKQSGQTIYLLPHHQLTNDCTSHGSSGSIEDEQFIRIMLRGLNEEWHAVASEPIYGGAVTTIMQTRGDNGAYTGAVLQYVQKYGYLARKKYTLDDGTVIDLSVYDSAKATAYSNRGVPAGLIPLEKEHQVLQFTPINSYEEGNPFIRQGCTIVDGSNQGFTMSRDKDGFCRPQGSWAHCTRFRGRRMGKKPGWAYGQSWGPGMPGGPLTVTLDDGRELDLPEGTFFVDPDTINAMIRQGEFYAVSNLSAFELLDNKVY